MIDSGCGLWFGLSVRGVPAGWLMKCLPAFGSGFRTKCQPVGSPARRGSKQDRAPFSYQECPSRGFNSQRRKVTPAGAHDRDRGAATRAAGAALRKVTVGATQASADKFVRATPRFCGYGDEPFQRSSKGAESTIRTARTWRTLRRRDDPWSRPTRLPPRRHRRLAKWTMRILRRARPWGYTVFGDGWEGRRGDSSPASAWS